MSKNYYRRFDLHDNVKSGESSSETLDKIDLPEDENQVTIEKEIERTVDPINVEPIKSVSGKVNVLSNMRSAPEIIDSNILCVVPANSSILVYEDAGDFYKVKYDGQFGYIKKDLCDKI